MKSKLILIMMILLGLILSSCDDSSTDPVVDESQKGNLEIFSTPQGASITLDGSATGNVTNFTYAATDIGSYTIALSFDGYHDTTVVAEVLQDETTNVNITLVPELISYESVEMWESLDPSSSHPSGLSLSIGDAYSISASNDNSTKNDIYYNSDGFLVVSSAGRNNMTRETYFYVGSSQNIDDGVNSPVKDGTWLKEVSVSERNYIFLYDADGNYSKLQIVEENAPTLDTYGSIVVKWYYNPVVGNVEF